MPAALLIGRLLGAGLLDAIEANVARTAAGLAVRELEEDDTSPVDAYYPVRSTAIRAIGWHRPSTITVEFMQRGTYTYDGDYELFIAFVNAPSKGQFFNAHFK